MATEKVSFPRVDASFPPVTAQKLTLPFQLFASWSAAGGAIILLASIAAMVWANTAGHESYHHLWHELKLAIGLGDWKLSMSLGHWINDALMVVFFFLVGLEIKRELLVGELSSVRKASVPVFAAIGGMAVPAAIYTALNHGTPTAGGWGVPMATDIAFALGAISIFGKRLPGGLRIFLASLAIADDLGALLVIAIFYTEDISLLHLELAFTCFLVMGLLNAMGVRRYWPYLAVATVMWFMVYYSGVHATIAGVLAAATIPVRGRVDGRQFSEYTRAMVVEVDAGLDKGAQLLTDQRMQAAVQNIEDACNKAQSPLHECEHMLVPWVAFLVVPIFALANAGVHINAGSFGDMLSRPSLGIFLGLLVGKPIGITLFSYAAVKLGIGELPKGVTWLQLHGAAWLGGIGFTMALFIANLAFTPEQLDVAKLSVLAASMVATVVGMGILFYASKKKG